MHKGTEARMATAHLENYTEFPRAGGGLEMQGRGKSKKS